MEVDDVVKSVLEIQKQATSYPDLVRRLIGIGIESYTVDVATETTLYRRNDGVHGIKYPEAPPQSIASDFDRDKTIQAVRNTQQGKTDYRTFMREIANAGVRFYEATLSGERKRVTYIGRNGSYSEDIPIVVRAG